MAEIKDHIGVIIYTNYDEQFFKELGELVAKQEKVTCRAMAMPTESIDSAYLTSVGAANVPSILMALVETIKVKTDAVSITDKN